MVDCNTNNMFSYKHSAWINSCDISGAKGLACHANVQCVE